jgi:hypothetical protein
MKQSVTVYAVSILWKKHDGSMAIWQRGYNGEEVRNEFEALGRALYETAEEVGREKNGYAAVGWSSGVYKIDVPDAKHGMYPLFPHQVWESQSGSRVIVTDVEPGLDGATICFEHHDGALNRYTEDYFRKVYTKLVGMNAEGREKRVKAKLKAGQFWKGEGTFPVYIREIKKAGTENLIVFSHTEVYENTADKTTYAPNKQENSILESAFRRNWPKLHKQ